MRVVKKARRYFVDLTGVSKELRHRAGRPTLLTMIDIVGCTLKYGASPNNYLTFEFADLSAQQRASYVTHKVSERLIAKYNQNEYRPIFEDKSLFAQRFGRYFGRDWVDLAGLDEKGLEEFVAGKEAVIYKPRDGSQGKGVEKLLVNNDVNSLFAYLKEKDGILEEWIRQHDVLDRLYSGAVNPVRIITVVSNGECHFLVAGLTIGNGRQIANASCKDMVAPIDIESGIIKYDAQDSDGHVYQQHPMTGCTIRGVQIPFWSELLDLVDAASRIVPEVGYVGWDVAVTPQGPILIEGNTSPGYESRQLVSHLPEKMGNRAIYERYL